jgi:A/G-specific adenine glycosylase
MFEHVLSEILLQRTRAEMLAPFFRGFVQEFQCWEDIAKLSVSELECVLRPIGLSKQRAPRIHSLAVILANNGGELPNSVAKLQELPAIGQYVAYAIQVYRGNSRLPLLDASMARVIERCFGPRQRADIRYDPGLQETAQRLVDCDRSIEMSWAILDLAALICKSKSPDCDSCPLTQQCRFEQGGLRRIDQKTMATDTSA